jgi:hypothetical protein
MINEIAEQLQAASIETAFPLSLPELEDIVDAQEELLIHIPPALRDYLLHCSNVIFGSLEPVTIADPSYHTYLPEVAAEAWDRGLPRDLIPVCQDGDDYFAVSQDDTVHRWHAEEDHLEEISEDIWAWARDVWLAK